MNLQDLELVHHFYAALMREGVTPERIDNALPHVVEMLELYNEPHRHYHNVAHVLDCLKQCEREPSSFRLAVIFHDVIYDIGATDNELRSAEFAMRVLEDIGYPAPKSVYRLIMATTHQHKGTTPQKRLIQDIDLSGLGSDWDKFSDNTRKIHAETGAPDEAFALGRAKWLESMLERPEIYYTDKYKFLCEGMARANMKRELDSLTVPTS